jgi:hypothetical protein
MSRCLTPQTSRGSEVAGVVLNTPERATLRKREYGQRHAVAIRTVDNWLRKGLPHLKISERLVRIPVIDADAWLLEKFRVQRRA